MPANLAGLPALALPVPGGPAGLPASLQLIGPPGSEGSFSPSAAGSKPPSPPAELPASQPGRPSPVGPRR